MRKLALLMTLGIFVMPSISWAQRWSESKADDWYSKQPWLVGANFISADAINQLEMWQADTFNPQEIDKELGWAQGLGMNTMRVFLHDLLWQQDAAAFQKRIDIFLGIAAKHHIRPIFVVFDSCWEPEPRLGPQHPPIPGVHNSGWVQSPGQSVLKDPTQRPRLKSYVEGLISAFGSDDRILAWDLWNEPADSKEVVELLPQVFEWARSMHPIQPLTSGLHTNYDQPQAIQKIQLEESDVISFHSYSWPEQFEFIIRTLRKHNRPVLCTEYMARGVGSTFDTILPIAKKEKVAAINWGLVNGKTQTDLPWDSWQRPYTVEKLVVWFHDIFHPDGTPYRAREVDIFRDLTGASNNMQQP